MEAPDSPVPFSEETSCSSDFVLESPTTVREFENKKGQQWAKQIVIDYWTRTDQGWLLAPLLKILSVIAKENPTPGGLSRSYHLEVFYKTGENMTQLHWFVKIPRSLQTVAMDERELVMYNNIFPRLNTFIKNHLKPGGWSGVVTGLARDHVDNIRREGPAAHPHHLLLQLHGRRRQ